MATRTESQAFEAVLEHLRQARGFDFTAYKRASLMRRVVKRMHTVEVATFEAYLDYLQVHQEEFEALFNTILINVTTFFRDPDVWEYVDSTVLPARGEARAPGADGSRQDLRDRRGQRGAHAGAAGGVPGPAHGRYSSTPAGEVLRYHGPDRRVEA
jgi:hypothetical protein